MLIGVTWNLFVTADARLQLEQDIITQRARNYVIHGIYSQAITTLLEAIELEDTHNPNLLYELAHIYYSADNFRQYRATLQVLLDTQTLPEEMELADLYLEIFQHDLLHSSTQDTIFLLRDGWEATDDLRLFELYEAHRYAFIERRGTFAEASVIFDNAGRVKQGERWGFVNANGNIVMPPRYGIATNFMSGNAAVQRDGVLEIINRMGLRQSIADFSADSIAHFDGSNFAVLIYGNLQYVQASWRTGDLEISRGETTFDFIGMPSEGIRITQRDGLWGIEDRGGRDVNISTDHIYESIAIDMLGRSAVNGRLFVNENGQYHMIDYAANHISGPFDEARPFFENGGLAAVRRGEQWGLINNQGQVIIDFIYDDARSSSFNLAPVQVDGLWGYISLENYPEPFRDQFFGRIVIEPQFLDAQQLVNGVGPVLGESGWFYISLIEFD